MMALSPQRSARSEKTVIGGKLGSFPSDSSELSAIPADFLLRSTGRFAAPHPLPTDGGPNCC